ncbi:hypothetical protein J3Q64DRAFT_1729444 [Phycomyces blakesleeanus]|uniref:N-acetyltransferase domain-containing protein n=2 Tax=Phycomyces blakesleeanus TaxID=4837 RepID=A0A163AWG2_PHYB8|nr:hypothetical protein PHYBLDRAFT_186199 [Phycomyces blakesleeanus NRRL 1555(-)]OAD76241.1 hypothetical protein PHYBLDRAFT_186199 [Phycomyces blakesleeanus NRRL 1555(-)]|eukprot:XP_018294281.1 hypothetical protein PHYBLDRAFT_186199 [Phycomyces blakesleeanus NRRL 1555(-)]
MAESLDNKTPETETPRLVLRTYRATDFPHVDHMFVSNYFALVPEGVRRKLWSPATWVVWFAVYSYLLMIVPVLLGGMDFPSWADTVLKLFFTFSWGAIGFAALFIITDQFDTQDRVEYARQNDMKDPEVYYLNWNKKEVEVEDAPKGSSEKKQVTFDKDAKPATEIIRERKPESEQTPSHFWVLSMDGEPCGMVGLAINKDTVFDQRPAQLAPWQKIGAGLFRRYNFSVPKFLDTPPKVEPKVFSKAHGPRTATLTRLTVKYDYQNCGLSTLLVNRALSWANENGIDRVYAETNEMMMAAEQILEKRHGFKRINKKSTGWFGQYEAEWECNVKEWVAKHEDQTKEAFKKT